VGFFEVLRKVLCDVWRKDGINSFQNCAYIFAKMTCKRSELLMNAAILLSAAPSKAYPQDRKVCAECDEGEPLLDSRK